MIKVTCDRCRGKMKEDNQYYIDDKWVDLCGKCEGLLHAINREIEVAKASQLKIFMEGK